jgi:hypothetical protein
MLPNIEDLISELERNPTEEHWFYVLIARKLKASCLAEIDKKKEAIGLLRLNLVATKVLIGVTSNLVFQNTYALNTLLIREKEDHKIAENPKYLLGLISKERGTYHEDALLEQRKITEHERKHQNKLVLNGTQRSCYF